MLPSPKSDQIKGPIRPTGGLPTYSSYLHVLDGRIRIKVSGVKGQPLNASRVEKTLYQLDGVTHVKANPATGNVLILFDSHAVGHQHILELIAGLELSNIRRLNPYSVEDLTTQQLAKALVKKAAKGIGKQLFYLGIEMAVDRITLGLIPRKAWRFRL